MPRFKFLFLSMGALALTSCSSFLPSPNRSSSSTSKGPSSSLSGDASVPVGDSSAEEAPHLEVKTDDVLSYDEEGKKYVADVTAGDSYRLSVGMGDYRGDQYHVVTSFLAGEEYATLNQGVLAFAEDLGSYASVQTVLLAELKKVSANNALERAVIYFTIHEDATANEIAFQTDDAMALEGERYHLYLKLGQEYTLKPQSLRSGYRMEYQIDANARFLVSEQGKVSLKEEAQIGDVGTLTAKLFKGESLRDVTYIRLSVCENYRQASLSLLSHDERVVVQVPEEQYTTYKYRLSIPYGGNDYPMPEVLLEGYEGDYHLVYESLSESLSIDSSAEKTTFQAHMRTAAWLTRFTITAYTEEDVRITQITVGVLPSFKGRGEFVVSYGEQPKALSDGVEIALQKRLSYAFRATYNGESIPLSLCLSVEGDGLSLRSNTLTAKKLGANTLTFAYAAKDIEGTEYTYTVRVKVNVVDESKPVELFVAGGASSLSVYEGNVFVDGKIYVRYDVGDEAVVNGSEGLSYRVETDELTAKKRVILTYQERGYTVTASYEVAESVEHPRFTPTKNYQWYFDQWKGYRDAVKTFPASGKANILVLPIAFTDTDDFLGEGVDARGLTHREQIREDLKTAVFGLAEEAGWHSVASFYGAESNGTLSLSGTVAPWYECPKASASVSSLNSSDTMAICNAAVDAYFAAYGEEDPLSNYDKNGDGEVDAAMCYYGANYYGPNHYSRAYQAYTTQDGLSCGRYVWMSALDIYGLSGADPDQSKQKETGDLSSLYLDGLNGFDTRTSLHEFGHTFGLDDYYDEVRDSAGGQWNHPAGGFSMQDSNNASHDPYSYLAIGWARPYLYDATAFAADEEIHLTLRDFQSSHDMILLTPKLDAEADIFDEFLLLELYTPTELNAYYAWQGTTATGIRLWHVNAAMQDKALCYVNSTQATGKDYDLLHWIRNGEDVGFKSSTLLKDGYLFGEGSSFTMERFQKQFLDQMPKLDNGKPLGWAFDVGSILVEPSGRASAEITLRRV